MVLPWISQQSDSVSEKNGNNSWSSAKLNPGTPATVPNFLQKMFDDPEPVDNGEKEKFDSQNKQDFARKSLLEPKIAPLESFEFESKQKSNSTPKLESNRAMSKIYRRMQIRKLQEQQNHQQKQINQSQYYSQIGFNQINSQHLKSNKTYNSNFSNNHKSTDNPSLGSLNNQDSPNFKNQSMNFSSHSENSVASKAPNLKMWQNLLSDETDYNNIQQQRTNLLKNQALSNIGRSKNSNLFSQQRVSPSEYEEFENINQKQNLNFNINKNLDRNSRFEEKYNLNHPKPPLPKFPPGSSKLQNQEAMSLGLKFDNAMIRMKQKYRNIDDQKVAVNPRHIQFNQSMIDPRSIEHPKWDKNIKRETKLHSRQSSTPNLKKSSNPFGYHKSNYREPISAKPKKLDDFLELSSNFLNLQDSQRKTRDNTMYGNNQQISKNQITKVQFKKSPYEKRENFRPGMYFKLENSYTPENQRNIERMDKFSGNSRNFNLLNDSGILQTRNNFDPSKIGQYSSNNRTQDQEIPSNFFQNRIEFPKNQFTSQDDQIFNRQQTLLQKACINKAMNKELDKFFQGFSIDQTIFGEKTQDLQPMVLATEIDPKIEEDKDPEIRNALIQDKLSDLIQGAPVKKQILDILYSGGKIKVNHLLKNLKRSGRYLGEVTLGMLIYSMIEEFGNDMLIRSFENDGYSFEISNRFKEIFEKIQSKKPENKSA
ncbi:MAG: hypothetical protein ACTSVL_01645 [Promethearchaeota archaeon]